ncbi:MAG TPA: hypothetical protein VKH63_09175 [Candidatus Acidoferrum sp.]|nr:hypothetical protein [Candidatus Acidoferrum sp.]
MFGWLKRRPNKVKAANYSIEMRTIFRECMDIVYEEHGHKFYFGGEKVGKKWRQVNLGVPTNLAPEDQYRVLANLGAGLKELGYEFVIFRTGEPQPIPEHEQQAARSELHEMGLEPEVAPDKSTVRLSKLPGWKKPASFDPKEQARRMSRLVVIVRGKCSPIEILARSDAAEIGFN